MGLESFLRNNWKELSFIIGLVVIGLVLGGFILNLKNDMDRIWFQGYIAFTLVLVIFVEFDLEYRNRKRNILYAKQMDAIKELDMLLANSFDMFQNGLVSLNSLFQTKSQWVDFILSSRALFVRKRIRKIKGKSEVSLKPICIAILQFIEETLIQQNVDQHTKLSVRFVDIPDIPVVDQITVKVGSDEEIRTKAEMVEELTALIQLLDQIIDEELRVL